jgi:hypothetical protein
MRSIQNEKVRAFMQIDTCKDVTLLNKMLSAAESQVRHLSQDLPKNHQKISEINLEALSIKIRLEELNAK